jgi:hypothetical protein
MRFLLEKATNFSDIRRVICFDEPLKLDTAIDCKKFSKEATSDTPLADPALLQSLWAARTPCKLSRPGLSNHQDVSKYARSTLYT